MTKPHLQGFEIIDNYISTCCEIFDTELDEYISCEATIFEDKNLINKFKKLNLKNKDKVLGFIKNIEDRIDWNKISNILYFKTEKEKQRLLSKKDQDQLNESNIFSVICENEKINFLKKDLALSYYNDLACLYEDEEREKYSHIYKNIQKSKYEYSDGTEIKKEKYIDYNNYYDMDAVIVPAKKLGEGWYWYKYNDGSGHLQSPSGKEYMIYDLETHEYMGNKNSSWNSYTEGWYEFPKDFNFFRFAEKEMIDYILPREQNNKEKQNSIIRGD